jgi:hypothetical protein
MLTRGYQPSTASNTLSGTIDHENVKEGEKQDDESDQARPSADGTCSVSGKSNRVVQIIQNASLLAHSISYSHPDQYADCYRNRFPSTPGA